MAQENTFDIIAKGMTSFLKAKASSEKARIDMQSKLALADIDRRQDYLYKIAGREHQGPMQRKLEHKYDLQQQGLGRGGTPLDAPSNAPGYEGQRPGAEDVRRDPFDVTAEQRSKIELKQGGYTEKTIGIKDAIFQNINRKPEGQRTEKERKFLETYLGTAEKGITATQAHKEELQKKEAMEILERGTWYSAEEGEPVPFEDRQQALDYLMDNYDIDIADPDIQDVLSKYKEPEDPTFKEDTRNWWEKTVSQRGPAKATRQKYGYTYEKRPDGKWHKVNE